MTHTAEEVRANVAENRRHMTTATEAQLTAYADLLERSEAGVTEEVVGRCYDEFLRRIDARTFHELSKNPQLAKYAMRAALTAVWPVAAEQKMALTSDQKKALLTVAIEKMDFINGLLVKLHEPAQPADSGRAMDVPMGAIENGRIFADRLESTGLECEAGNLAMCSDWQEFRRCFEYLSEWALHLAAQGQPAKPVQTCTCPSGDGSLRWPCPVHPPAERVPDGWRPIETAPKDGTPIFGCIEGECYTGHGFLPVCVRWVTFHPNAAGKATWRAAHGYKVGHLTHWMPLPAAPQPGEPQ